MSELDTLTECRIVGRKPPTDPIKRAFWEGWFSASESHCNNWHGKDSDTWTESWKKSQTKRRESNADNT